MTQSNGTETADIDAPGLNRGSNQELEGTKPPSKMPQYLAAVTVNLAAFTYGSVVAWPATTVPVLTSELSPVGDEPMTTDQVAFLGSLLCLGALVATPFYGYVSGRYGRKVSGYLIAVPFIVSWLVILFANSAYSLLIARFIVGFGSAGALYVCPMYVGEVTEDTLRGALGAYLVLFINIGILFSYVVGSFCSYNTLILSSLTIPVVFLFAFYWLPESPIYFLTKDRPVEAMRSLRWFRGGLTPEVEDELGRMTSLVNEMRSTTSVKDLLTSRCTRRGLVIGLVLSANQQLSGIFAILSFAVTIFEKSDCGLSPNASAILIGVFQLCGSFCATLLMDRLGRRILLIISNTIMANCLGALSGYYYLSHMEYDVSNFTWIPVLCLSIHISFFTIGVGPIPFIVISEIFSPQIRNVVVTICMMSIWGLAFLVTYFFINLMGVLGPHGCYGIFSAVCTLGSIFAMYGMIETKNRSLDSILRQLGGEAKPKEPIAKSDSNVLDSTNEISRV